MEENDEESKQEEVKIRRPRWIPRWINAPQIIFISAIVGILFLQPYNIFIIGENDARIKDLKLQIKTNQDSAKYYSQKVQLLNSSPELIEKIAREQYYMKRANEDVYITDNK